MILILAFQRNGNVCHEGCTKGGVYDPSDTECELRWCGPCRKWFHSCCIETERDLDVGEDEEQLYLLEKGNDLFSRLISRPVRRFSRKNDAPLSLEKIQTHLIGKWRSINGRIYDSEMMIEAVKESDLFGWDVDRNWEQTIETSLKDMGSWEWMICPLCLSSYI